MLRLKFLALMLLATTALSPLGARADEHPLKGVALVIGESDYDTLQKLDNPRHDARAMDDMLDQLGFSVDRVLDGDAKKLRAEIADFIAQAKDADVALVYYSGHGVEAGGTDFMVPTDTDLKTPETAGQSLVPVSDLLDQLAKTVPVTIMLLDACRTNSFPAGTACAIAGRPRADAGRSIGPRGDARADAGGQSQRRARQPRHGHRLCRLAGRAGARRRRRARTLLTLRRCSSILPPAVTPSAI